MRRAAIDEIQGIVSRYTSELFEVAVGFGKRDGVEHPVIGVPEGVRVPVAAKAELKDANEKILVRLGGVYFRPLGSNGTVSTAIARPSDWRDIMEICFENREADIGRRVNAALMLHWEQGRINLWHLAATSLYSKFKS